MDAATQATLQREGEIGIHNDYTGGYDPIQGCVCLMYCDHGGNETHPVVVAVAPGLVEVVEECHCAPGGLDAWRALYQRMRALAVECELYHDDGCDGTYLIGRLAPSN